MLAERGSAQLVKARKGPAAAPTPPLQGTKKINLCYRGFNKWRFDIVHHKLSVLMSSSSSSASCQRSWRRRWERQPRPQAVIQLVGTATQTHCVLHQLLLEPKPSEDCPESQKPAASQCHPHWPGSPRRAAAGRGQCRPQYHVLEQSLVLPLHMDQLSRRDFCSVRDELTAENPFCFEPKAETPLLAGTPRRQRCIHAAAGKLPGVQRRPRGYGNMQ